MNGEFTGKQKGEKTMTIQLNQAAKEARNAYMKEYKKTLTDEQKQQQRDYHKKWRANNKERIKEHQERYWMKKAKELTLEKH